MNNENDMIFVAKERKDRNGSDKLIIMMVMMIKVMSMIMRLMAMMRGMI